MAALGLSDPTLGPPSLCRFAEPCFALKFHATSALFPKHCKQKAQQWRERHFCATPISPSLDETALEGSFGLSDSYSYRYYVFAII